MSSFDLDYRLDDAASLYAAIQRGAIDHEWCCMISAVIIKQKYPQFQSKSLLEVVQAAQSGAPLEHST